MSVNTHNNLFVEVSTRWHQEPWIKYLYENATIEKIDVYIDSTYATVYVINWNIDEKKKTFFLLKWAEKLTKIYN